VVVHTETVVFFESAMLSHCVWAIHTSQHISTYLTPSKNAKKRQASHMKITKKSTKILFAHAMSLPGDRGCNDRMLQRR